MSREINFLEERRKRVVKVIKSDRRFFQTSTIIFSVVFICSHLVFAVRFYVDRQLSSIEADTVLTKTRIVSNQEIERSFVLFVHKLSLLSQIYQNRQDKKETIDYFSTVFGPDVLVSQIEFDQATKLIQFNLQSKDVFTLEKVIEILSSDDVRARFSSVNPSGLSRSADGKYQLSLSVTTPNTTAVTTPSSTK